MTRVEAKRHERGQIWTYAELLVTDGVKGSTKSAIVVKQPGGVVGEVGQRVSGAATFRPSEDVVLFLEPAVDEPGAFVVMSLTAGKVTFEDVRGVRAAVRHLDGVTFAEAGTRQTLHAIEPLEVLGPPEAFIAQLKGYVKQGAR